MRIVIAGAGPAGLLFALLMKRSRPQDDVLVIEQNPSDNTYGWGVVFSGGALEFLGQALPDLVADLDSRLEQWDELTIVHRDTSVAIDGNRFSGIARLTLLELLQRHASSAGVRLRFDTRFTPQSAVDADLVVGADGVNSALRDADSDGFGTDVKQLSNHFVWYGTSCIFKTLSLIFRNHQAGHFVAHTYRYSPTMSTFLVECDSATFKSAGLENMSDVESRQFCEEIFETELQGHKLESNHSTWRQFPVVTNRNWVNTNRVLLGDALRTVHFSIGSGTRTAMQDALALFESVRNLDDRPEPAQVTAALQAFTDSRRPSSDKLLEVANASMQWYEDFALHMDKAPWNFAMNYMTRGGRVDIEKLRERSPRFVQAWENSQSS